MEGRKPLITQRERKREEERGHRVQVITQEEHFKKMRRADNDKVLQAAELKV